jgi:RimJ/RimL family protein N-acetyltransferase
MDWRRMIKTERLTLIPLTRQNLETGLASIKQLSVDLNVPIIADLMTGEAAAAIDKKLVVMHDLPPELHPWCTYWLVVLDCDNLALGLAGFKGVPAGDGKVELGYSIDHIYQGRGYMTETIRALVNWAFAHPECREVKAFTQPGNIASRKVLVKNGFEEIQSIGGEIEYRKTRD